MLLNQKRTPFLRILLVTLLLLLGLAGLSILQVRTSLAKNSRVTAARSNEPAKDPANDPTTKLLKNQAPDSLPGEIVVRFRGDASLARATLKGGAHTESVIDASGRQLQLQIERLDRGPELVEGLRLVHVAPEEAVDAIEVLRSRPDVIYAEPNYIRRKLTAPNDPSYPGQWSLKNTGQSGGTPGADIHAEAAWDVTTGSRNVVVGVIDEGVDINHPDLAANIWTNPGEIPGNGVDDDGDGFVDDVNGWDFFHNDASVYDGPGTNADGSQIDAHGTHVAGTIGAIGNNTLGVAGVAWQVSLMSLKFLGPNGGSTSDLLKAYGYAKMMRDRFVSSGGTQGANIRITNNSYGGDEYSQAEADAIQAMSDSGILLVAAAGNDSYDNSLIPTYPASYDLPNVISVAATGNTDNLAPLATEGSMPSTWERRAVLFSALRRETLTAFLAVLRWPLPTLPELRSSY